LPRDVQRQLLEALARHRAELRPLLQSVQTARAAAVQAAQAQPFDRAKTEAALNDLRGAVDALMQAAQGIALDALASRSGAPRSGG
jgi:uncharacterized membrane protein